MYLQFKLFNERKKHESARIIHLFLRCATLSTLDLLGSCLDLIFFELPPLVRPPPWTLRFLPPLMLSSSSSSETTTSSAESDWCVSCPLPAAPAPCALSERRWPAMHGEPSLRGGGPRLTRRSRSAAAHRAFMSDMVTRDSIGCDVSSVGSQHATLVRVSFCRPTLQLSAESDEPSASTRTPYTT